MQLNGASYFEGHTLWPEIWNQTVHGMEVPKGWVAPTEDHGWQVRDYVYVDLEAFIGLVEAAVWSRNHTIWDRPLRDICDGKHCHCELDEGGQGT